jgi:cytochrome c oxidase assembly protein subunit 15
VSACTLLLVMAGASVVSKQAGLSVPDWPLSYGQVMPAMTGGVLYEHGHRMIATAVGFLTIVLMLWLWRAEDRKWMKWLGFFALMAVIVQGLLGGLTVLYLLPKAVSIGHASLAQVFFCVTVAIAVFTSPVWRRTTDTIQDGGWPSLRSLAWVTPVAVLAQVALGAAYRHKATGVIPHVVWAAGAGLLVAMLSIFVLAHPVKHALLRRTAVWLLTLTSVQVLLGVVALWARVATEGAREPASWMVWTTVAHVGVGALVLGLTVALSLQILRFVTAAVEAPIAPQRLVGRAG